MTGITCAWRQRRNGLKGKENNDTTGHLDIDEKLATLVSAVALSATVSANAMAKDTIALVISTLNNPFFVSIWIARQATDKTGFNLIGSGFAEQPGERAG